MDTFEGVLSNMPFFSMISLVYCFWERQMVLCFFVSDNAHPDNEFGFNKVGHAALFPNSPFADSIHLSESETMKMSSTSTSTMHMPCIG
jgi:hypothetical protein